MKLILRMMKEPLLHFLVLAAGLFVLSHIFSESPGADEPDAIVVSEQRITSLILSFQRTWQRPPTRQELDGLIDDYIKEEVFYREALAMGMDRDDTLIRRRLRQKLEFVAEDLADTVEPTEQELQQHLNENPDSFRVEQRATFRHVYLKPELHGDGLRQDIQQLLDQLRGDDIAVDPSQLGDPSLLPHFYEDLRKSAVAGQFGPAFAAEVFALPAGAWNGPIESAYGVHLVLVEGKSEGRLPPLEEVRQAVRREWYATRRIASKEDFFQSLRDKYEIVVEELDSTDDGVAVPVAEQ